MSGIGIERTGKQVMNAQAFWTVIGEYNQQTIIMQSVLLVFLAAAVFLSYINRVRYSAKLLLGIANLLIGFVFFGYYGTEPIQKFFAFPLYLLCGFLFLYECFHNKNDILAKPNPFQMIMLVLYGLYPLISLALGNKFPQMVTHIMPCPIVSLSIIVYAGYKRKNKLLLTLLTIWGLTGIKSVIFSAYEDMILLICGIYGIFLLVTEIRSSKLKVNKLLFVEEKIVEELRKEIAIQQKKGLPFIMTSVVIWLLISLVSILDINMNMKNLLVFCCSCPLLPLSWIIGKRIKVDIFSKENPLVQLGFIFTLNQMIYLLIVMWVFSTVPEKMIMVYAMVFGAHLFPYSWLYKSKGYTVVAISIPVISLILGCTLNGTAVAVVVCIIEVVFACVLHMELKKMADN